MHTVFMATLIRDNGLISPLNRGTFYGCREESGRLKGLALIGHATIIETADDDALALFARLAQNCPTAYLIRGEQERVARFWEHYEPRGRRPRRMCRELLMEQRPPVAVLETVRHLRPATCEDLCLIMPVNAAMIADECGVNPLERDPVGFRVRLLRRIEQGRVWVWVQKGRLMFKTDVLANTQAAAYLEGVWVHPDERGRGYGLRCLSQLSRMLLTHTETVSLVVNETATAAQAFYRKAGYKTAARYDTIYLHT
jgi:predicted GNAT family acetyltransferase